MRVTIGSITSRCSGGTKTGLERAAEIEPRVTNIKLTVPFLIVASVNSNARDQLENGGILTRYKN